MPSQPVECNIMSAIPPPATIEHVVKGRPSLALCRKPQATRNDQPPRSMGSTGQQWCYIVRDPCKTERGELPYRSHKSSTSLTAIELSTQQATQRTSSTQSFISISKSDQSKIRGCTTSDWVHTKRVMQQHAFLENFLEGSFRVLEGFLEGACKELSRDKGF